MTPHWSVPHDQDKTPGLAATFGASLEWLVRERHSACITNFHLQLGVSMMPDVWQIPLGFPRKYISEKSSFLPHRLASLHQKYGNSSEGFAAFVEEQVSAFEACAAEYGGDTCARYFETLSMREEKVYYHCDNVSVTSLPVKCSMLKTWPGCVFV